MILIGMPGIEKRLAREGRFGDGPSPFLGYLFLLEDRANVKVPVRNKEPYFAVDPVFRGDLKEEKNDVPCYKGVSYSARYQLLCRRLITERLYSSACFLMATNSKNTRITQRSEDLTFRRFAAAIRGHAVTFLESIKK